MRESAVDWKRPIPAPFFTFEIGESVFESKPRRTVRLRLTVSREARHGYRHWVAGKTTSIREYGEAVEPIGKIVGVCVESSRKQSCGGRQLANVRLRIAKSYALEGGRIQIGYKRVVAVFATRACGAIHITVSILAETRTLGHHSEHCPH